MGLPHAGRGDQFAPTPGPSFEAPGFSFLGRGAPVESQSQKLYSLLLSRLAADGALNPPYLGEVSSHAALPRRLPPVYAWLDLDGVVHLNTSRAAIARICIRESIRTGMPVAFGDAEVELAVSRFCDLVASTWSATRIEHPAAACELKSAKQRAALRWSAAR